MNVISILFGVIGFTLLVWLFVSAVDVAVHNINDPQQIGNWNVYKITVEA